VFHTQESASIELLRDAKYIHFGSSYKIINQSTCYDNLCHCAGLRMPNVVHVSGVPIIETKNLGRMFEFSKLTNSPDLARWDVSKVENFSDMFADAKTFDTDIGGWNVSSVKNMCAMFLRAHQFSANIGGWNVSNVKYTVNMFYQAYNFKTDLSCWNMPQLCDYDYMFCESGINNFYIK
jgi:hypothetical protein